MLQRMTLDLEPG